MQRWQYIDEAHTVLDIFHYLEISRFRSAIYRRCGHFFLYKYMKNKIDQSIKKVIILLIPPFPISDYVITAQPREGLEGFPMGNIFIANFKILLLYFL